MRRLFEHLKRFLFFDDEIGRFIYDDYSVGRVEDQLTELERKKSRIASNSKNTIHDDEVLIGDGEISKDKTQSSNNLRSYLGDSVAREELKDLKNQGLNRMNNRSTMTEFNEKQYLNDDFLKDVDEDPVNNNDNEVYDPEEELSRPTKELEYDVQDDIEQNFKEDEVNDDFAKIESVGEIREEIVDDLVQRKWSDKFKAKSNDRRIVKGKSGSINPDKFKKSATSNKDKIKSKSNTNHTERLKRRLDLVYLVRGKDRGRPAWHYVLVDKKLLPIFLEKTKGGTVDVAQYGKILYSGWGENPPEEMIDKIREEYGE